jgi:hypothetical protein
LQYFAHLCETFKIIFMKNSVKLFVAVAMLAASCAPKKDKYEIFAEDLCKCMKPMADFQNQITDMLAAGGEDSLMTKLQEAQKIEMDGQTCIAGLEAKHGKIEGEEAEGKAMEALRKVCPDVVALMEQVEEPTLSPEDFLEEGEMMDEAAPEGEGTKAPEGN